MDLTLKHYLVHEDIAVIEAGGELDVYTSPRLRELVIDLISSGHVWLIIDLSRIEYQDSTGLGVMVGALKRTLAHEGALCLIVSTDRIMRQFRITGFTIIFRILDNLDAAIEMFYAEPFKAKMLPGAFRSYGAQQGVDWFPGRVYISSQDAAAEVEDAWVAVLDAFGFEAKTYNYLTRRDPWYRQFMIRPKDAEGTLAGAEALALMQRAMEHQLHTKERAPIDGTQDLAVASLAVALAKTSNAIIQSGPGLLVKVRDTVTVGNPAPLELARWERIPGFFCDPEGILRELQRPPAAGMALTQTQPTDRSWPRRVIRASGPIV
jgi:anti-sigma B factor antagonist